MDAHPRKGIRAACHVGEHPWVSGGAESFVQAFAKTAQGHRVTDNHDRGGGFLFGCQQSAQSAREAKDSDPVSESSARDGLVWEIFRHEWEYLCVAKNTRLFQSSVL
jgi:hypothetical protein